MNSSWYKPPRQRRSAVSVGLRAHVSLVAAMCADARMLSLCVQTRRKPHTYNAAFSVQHGERRHKSRCNEIFGLLVIFIARAAAAEGILYISHNTATSPAVSGQLFQVNSLVFICSIFSCELHSRAQVVTAQKPPLDHQKQTIQPSG